MIWKVPKVNRCTFLYRPKRGFSARQNQGTSSVDRDGKVLHSREMPTDP